MFKSDAKLPTAVSEISRKLRIRKKQNAKVSFTTTIKFFII